MTAGANAAVAKGGKGSASKGGTRRKSTTDSRSLVLACLGEAWPSVEETGGGASSEGWDAESAIQEDWRRSGDKKNDRPLLTLVDPCLQISALTHIHAYMRKTNIYIYTYIQKYMQTYIYTYIVHTHMRTWVHTYCCAYMQTEVHTYISTHIHTHIQTYMH